MEFHFISIYSYRKAVLLRTRNFKVNQKGKGIYYIYVLNRTYCGLLAPSELRSLNKLGYWIVLETSNLVRR